MDEYGKTGLSGKSFMITWACDEHRVPLEVCQIGGAGDSWHVNGCGYCLLDLIPDDKGNICYHGNDWLAEDIRAVVELIEEFSGWQYKDVLFYRDQYPTDICRFPPYFEPIFRNKQQEVSYYRKKWQQAKKELELQSERELKIAWRR